MPLLQTGTHAPAFNLPDADGVKHRLSAFKGGPVVVYFYPKDLTSGCTTQACDFRDAHAAFARLDATIIGISPDPPTRHATFRAKHDLPFLLLSDERDNKDTPPVCDKWGVWQQRSMYGNTYMGVVRTTYLLNASGKITRRWDKVKVKGHVDEVLAALR